MIILRTAPERIAWIKPFISAIRVKRHSGQTSSSIAADEKPAV